MANIHRVDLALESGSVSAARVTALVLCFLVAVVDGFDFVSIGVVAPLMMDDLDLSPAGLGGILALTQIGAAVGALSLGRAADIYGRRPLILLSLSLIALFTALTPLARSFEEMLLIRFLVGIALAGAVPATLSLVAEIAPRRARATILALIIAGFPLGAALGSIAGGAVAAQQGWESIFFLGATLAITLACVAWFLLPESPRYLAQHDHSDRATSRTMARLAPGTDVARLWEPLPRIEWLPGDAGNESAGGGAFSGLFAPTVRRSTWMLWIMLFCSGALSNVTLVWIPTILSTAGFGIGLASAVVGSLNIGATIGMALAGRILDATGVRVTVGVAFAVCTIATGLLGIVPPGTWLIGLGGVLGFFLGITTSAGYALSALIYPASFRSTGVGAAAAALRIGTISAPLFVPIVLSLGLAISWTFAAIALVPFIAMVVALRFRRPA